MPSQRPHSGASQDPINRARCQYLLVALALLFNSLHTANLWAADSRATQPNVLLIYVDDLGYGDLGSYGHTQLKTPELDRLASEGVRLTNYYAPSALCSPSRAGLLTGRHPYRTGIDSWIPTNSQKFLASEEITLAELLQSAGYKTALVGKWHLNSDLGDPNEPQPLDQGFDYAYGHNAFQLPTNKNPTNLYRNGRALPVQSGYTADLYADDAIAWITQNKSQPFFLMLSMAEPHTSIENPPAWNGRYAEFTRGAITPIRSGLKHPPKADLIPRGPGEYYANISYMDHQIGRVLTALKAEGLDESTLVVFASDNGPVTSQWINWWEVNAYGSTAGLRGRKHMVFEGGIKVPAIVRYPNHIEAGTQSSELIVGMDLFTTIAHVAGVDIPTDRAIDGQNVWSSLLPKTKEVSRTATRPPRNLLWALEDQPAPPFAWREANWKLVLTADHSVFGLFDLTTDPLELFNLAADNKDRVVAMQKRFVNALSELKSDPLRVCMGKAQPCVIPDLNHQDL